MIYCQDDDVILHCNTKTHADQLLKLVHQRMDSVGLELHPQKTKIVYCRDYKRKEKHPTVKFDFLGYSFQPRTAYSKKKGNLFLGYDCAISIDSRKQFIEIIINILEIYIFSSTII